MVPRKAASVKPGRSDGQPGQGRLWAGSAAGPVEFLELLMIPVFLTQTRF